MSDQHNHRGRAGGLATLARHGIDHLREIGERGGDTMARRTSTEQYREWGRRGGLARHGKGPRP